MRRAMIASEVIKKTGRLDLSNFQIIHSHSRESQARWIVNKDEIADNDEVPVVIYMKVERSYSIEYPTLLG